MVSEGKLWFEKYLNERQQVVKYNNVQSQSKSIICGVPQGSIMGPLLFLLYNNDLSSLSERLLSFMFADDTSMLIHGKDVSLLEEEMNRELCKVTTWLKVNKLSLNIAKAGHRSTLAFLRFCVIAATGIRKHIQVEYTTALFRSHFEYHN